MSRTTPRRRSRGALAVTLAAASLLISACGGSTGSKDPAVQKPAKPGEKVALTFWSWVPGIDKAVDLWNGTHPDIQVKLEKISAGNTGATPRCTPRSRRATRPTWRRSSTRRSPSSCSSTA